MLSNLKTSRFYGFTAIALALLMSVTAFASGNSRFAFIDGAAGGFGSQTAESALTTTVPCAAPGESRSVSLPASTTTAGGIVTLAITVGDLTNCGVISYDLNVDFDPAVMTPAVPAFTQSGTLSSAMSVTPNALNAGHLIISGFQGAPLCDGSPGQVCVGGETLLILRFNYTGLQGTFSNVAFADYTDPAPAFHPGFVFNEGDPVPSPVTNGTVTFPAATPTNTDTPTPSSTATDTPTGTNTPTATSTSTATFTPTGTFTPTNTATNTNTPTPTPLCAQVDIDDKIVTTGSSVTLSVTTTNTTPLIPQAFSVDTHITYDPSMLALDTAPNPTQFGVTLGPVGLSNASNLLVNEPTPGLLVISLFSTSPFSGAGALVDLHFTALGAPGSFTPVYFTPWAAPYPTTDADGFKYNEGFPTTCLTDGSVAISGTVSGNIKYGNSIGVPGLRHVPNTTVDGLGAPSVTGLSDSVGNYFLSGFGSGTYNIVPSRLATVAPNTHGTSITAFDAARVQQRTVGVGAPFNAVQDFVADVTGADGITSLDATAIATWVVSGPTNFYQSGNWKFAPSVVTHSFVASETDNFFGYLMGEVTGNWCDPLEFGPGLCDPFGFTVFGVRPGPQRLTSVSAVKANASTGSDVVVPVNVSGAGNKGIISYQFDLKYDPAVIQPQANAVTVANTVSNRLFVVTNTSTPGLMKVAVFGATPITDAGVLLNLHFTAVGSAFDVSGLTFENFMFNEGSIRTNIVNGEVRLTPAVQNTNGEGGN